MFSTYDSYDKFTYSDIDELNKYNYRFSLSDRFIHVKNENGKYFESQTPFLKILKPIHITLNRKKEVAKKYLILETNDELDIDNQIGEFMFIINKIHEISQEKIKEKSLEWFGTEFDEIGLDTKVRRPIEQHRTGEFIRISIPTRLEDEVSKLSKETYVLCNIIFKGLKISNDYMNEEWEIVDLITQEKYDEEQNAELINNAVNEDSVLTLLDNIEPEVEPINETVCEDIVETVCEDIVETVCEHVNEHVNEKTKINKVKKDKSKNKIIKSEPKKICIKKTKQVIFK